MAASLDRVLGAEGRLQVLAVRPQAATDLLDGIEDNRVNRHDGLFQEWDDAMRRREFLMSGVVAAVSLSSDSSPVTGQPGQRAFTGGRELLEIHRDLRAAHGRMDNLRGAPAVYAQALQQHQQVLAWHAGLPSGTEQDQVAALAADTGSFLGFLTYDLNMPDAAEVHYRQAAQYARQASDLSLCANILGQMSRILAERGQHREALGVTDRALRLTHTHPAVRSWVHAVRAYHHACGGDARAASSDLSKSWLLLERADDGEIPSYIGYLAGPELSKWTGHTMNKLAHFSPGFATSAQSALDEARLSWSPSSVRGSAEVLSASALAYALSGRLEEAAQLRTRAIDIATTTGSSRNLHTALQTYPGGHMWL